MKILIGAAESGVGSKCPMVRISSGSRPDFKTLVLLFYYLIDAGRSETKFLSGVLIMIDFLSAVALS